MGKFNDFQWEDEETTTTSQPQAAASDDEFEALLANEAVQRVAVYNGAQVEGTILSLSSGSDTILVEISASQTGVMDKADLLEEDGTLKYKEGDAISAYVVSTKQGIQLSRSLGKSHQAGKDLELAQANRVPVKGKVVKDVKGGFEVMILNKRAFCPVSQIDSKYVEQKADYINKDFDFIVEKVEGNGRNIVVSRTALLKEKARLRTDELKAKVGTEEILSGSVTDLRDYGALVDIGGVEGFLHVSEISYARISRPSDILSRGENIKVKLLSIDDSGDRPRISLSMKAVDQDPWLTVRERFKESENYSGKVLSFGKHGAFVQLEPGVDGMIHLSEMSWEKRVHDPSEVLSIGAMVSVRVLSIDSDQKRISLSLKDIQDDPWQGVAEDFKPGTATEVTIERLKGFGAIATLRAGVTGLIPMKTLKAAFGEGYRKHCSPPKSLSAIVAKVELDQKKVLLTLPDVEDTAEDDTDYREFLATKKPATSEASGQKGNKRGSFGDLLAAAQAKKGKS